MKRKSAGSQETPVKKLKSDDTSVKAKKIKTKPVTSPAQVKKPNNKALKNNAPKLSKVVIKKEPTEIDITQSLTDTGHSKSKNFRFEKSGGKKAGKFKKAGKA